MSRGASLLGVVTQYQPKYQPVSYRRRLNLVFENILSYADALQSMTL
jgi:hypothetical protein